jgi:hypothetical protein
VRPTAIYWFAEFKPESLAIAVGSFADPSFPKRRSASWTRRKHDWMTISEGLSQYEKQRTLLRRRRGEWTTSSGIDWSVVPREQIERPPAQPDPDPNYGPTTPRMPKNSHSVGSVVHWNLQIVAAMIGGREASDGRFLLARR